MIIPNMCIQKRKNVTVQFAYKKSNTQIHKQ